MFFRRCPRVIARDARWTSEGGARRTLSPTLVRHLWIATYQPNGSCPMNSLQPVASLSGANDAFTEALLARGIDSLVARRIGTVFSDWPALKAAVEASDSRLSAADVIVVRSAMARREIPRETVRRLIIECEFRCCLCWKLDSDTGVVLHHIRPHEEAPDDSYENLIVLCPDHHSRVHTAWELARHPYPPDLLRKRKTAFTCAIADFHMGKRPAPGREQLVTPGSVAVPPAAPPNFIGREASTNDARNCLSRGRRRVAFIGMGGVGKTALALHTIAAARGDYPGGVFWQEFSGDGSGTQAMLRSLLHFLGGDPDGVDASDQIAYAHSLLAEKSRTGAVLIAFDNVQEISLGALAKLITGLPRNVSVLVTGREATIAASLNCDNMPLTTLARADSRQLLALVSGSAHAATGASSVERLLDLIGDLPLAVELVGRQVALRERKPGFALAQLCAQLDQFNGAVLSFPGHRGVAACFALSYDALDGPQQTLFRSVGIFAEGPLLISDIAAVNNLDVRHTEDLLDQLVSTSLLSWGSAAGEYRVHTLLHKYSSFRLGQLASEKREREQRYVDHFSIMIEETARKSPPDLRAIDAAYDNLTRAIRTSAEIGFHRVASNMVISLCADIDYFHRRFLAQESIPLIEIGMASAGKDGDSDRAAAHEVNLATAYREVGQIEEAIRRYQSVIKTVRQTCNDSVLADALQNLGLVMLGAGYDPAQVENVLKEAWHAAVRSRNTGALLAIFSALGGLYRQVGRLPEAQKFYSQALEAARLLKHELLEGNSLSNLGLIVDALGDTAEAEQLINEALAISRRIGDRRGEGNRIGHLAGIKLRRAEKLSVGPERYVLYEEARRLLDDALRLARETRDAEKEACWLMNLAHPGLNFGNSQMRVAYYRQGLSVATVAGFAGVEAQIRYNLAITLAEFNQLHAALEEFNRAAGIFAHLRSPLEISARRGAALAGQLIKKRENGQM